MVIASQLFITPVFAICIWNFGNTCTKQDITNTATNKVTASVTSGADSKANAKVDIGETKINADIIKQFIGSQDANQLFVPLVNQSTKQIESTNLIFKEFQNTIKDINKSNQELLTKQAEENRKFTEQLVKQVIASPPTIPIVSGSSSFPIILPTNSQTTPIYINEVNQQLTNTLNNLNTTLSNMSIPIAGGTVTNIPNGPGSTLAPVAIANLPTGGNIGTAATTVDINSAFVITQTTASQTITLPSPTLPTGSRLVTVQSGSGSTNSFTIYGETLSASQAVDLLWNGTAWINASGGDPTTQNLTYGRVNASADLPNTSYSATTPGTAIPFNATVYSSGMTFSGTNGITPSVAGRYRAGWLSMAGSGDFAFDGTYNIVQNGAVVGSVFIDQMQAAGVNQTTPFIDVDLVAGLAVTLNYQPTSNDSIVYERGSYFQLTQLPTAVAPVVNTVAEYGEVVQPSNIAFSATTDTDVMSFTLPSAGVWEVTYNVTSQINSSINGRGAWISDNSNVVIANTGSSAVSNPSGGTTNAFLPLTQTARITTTGATTYKVRFRADNAGTLVANVSGVVGGISSILQNKVVYNKIAGQLPSTGTTVDYVFARLTSDTVITIPTSDIIPVQTISGNIPNSGGIFTLSAGKTYELRGTVAKSPTDGTNGFAFQWANGTAGQDIGSPAQALPPSAAVNNSVSPTAYAIITPTVTTQVYLRNTEGGTRTATNQTSVTIKQLGSSNVIAGLYPGTWGTYTPTITAVTTNPTKPTSGIVLDTARYIVEGKKLTVNYTFWIGTAVGAAAGSGTYKFSLPAGYTIDTSAITTIASFDPTLANQNIANVVGTALLNRGSQSALTSRSPGFVYAADTNNVTASYILTAPSTHAMFDSAGGNAGLQSGIGWQMQFTVPIN